MAALRHSSARTELLPLLAIGTCGSCWETLLRWGLEQMDYRKLHHTLYLLNLNGSPGTMSRPLTGSTVVAKCELFKLTFS